MAEAAQEVLALVGDAEAAPSRVEPSIEEREVGLPLAPHEVEAAAEKRRADDVLALVGDEPKKPDPNKETADASAEDDDDADDDGDEWPDDVYQPAYAAGLTRADLDEMKPAARARLLLSLAPKQAVESKDEKKEPAKVEPIGPKMEDFTALFADEFDEETAKKLGPKFHKLLAPLYEAQGKAEQARREESEKASRAAFIASARAAFVTLPNAEKLYGKEGPELKREHRDARNRAANIADWLLAGAASRGVNLSTDDALKAAHDVVSSALLQQLAREDVADKLKQRTNARSIAPSHARAGKPRALTGREAYDAEAAQLLAAHKR